MINKVDFLKVSSMLIILGAFSCTYDVLPTEDACTDRPSISLVSTKDTDCGSGTGEIIVESDGLEGTSIKYVLNDDLENTSGRFTNLSAGTYQVSVETLEGCRNTLSVEIKNLSGFNISIQSIASDCEQNTGRIVISTSGGEPPIRYRKNNEVFQTETIFEELAIGTYQIIAEDATGCQVSQNVEIKSNVSFSSIQSIIQTNCVSASCHGGNVSPDFRQNSNIVNSAERIKSRTQSKSMPPSSSGKSLTEAEIDLISCWVDGGVNQ